MLLHYEELAKGYGIGITGGIATGKSTVSKYLQEQGQLVIDADSLARKAVAPETGAVKKIQQAFAADILTADGKKLDRQKLKKLIFADAEQKSTLEKILHPIIKSLLIQELKDKGLFHTPNLWFYDAALLVETGNHQLFRRLWVTHCRKETQIVRLVKRDFTAAQALQAINSQLPTEVKLKQAHFRINTDGEMHATLQAVYKELQQEISCLGAHATCRKDEK